MTREEREGFLDALIRESPLVEITESLNVCRHPRDNHVLELALSGKASLIVTGDRDLLALHPFRSILILSPAEFLQTGGKPSGEAGTQIIFNVPNGLQGYMLILADGTRLDGPGPARRGVRFQRRDRHAGHLQRHLVHAVATSMA